MVNKVFLIGRVGGAVEKVSQDVARFSLATNERYKSENGEIKEITEWHKITCFGKLAEFAMDYIEKGKQVYVEGKLHYYKSDDGKSYTSIIAKRLYLLGNSGKLEKAKESYSNDDDIPF